MTQPRSQFKVLFPLPSDWIQSGARDSYLGELIPAVKQYIEERSGVLEVAFFTNHGSEQDIDIYHRLVAHH